MKANSATATANGMMVGPPDGFEKTMSPPKMPSNRTASHIATMLTAPQNAGTRSRAASPSRSGLVLADDNLQTVVTAAEEGRRVYGNIRRFLLYGLSGGSAEIAVMLAGPVFGLALPLLPAQILWVNLLTHGLPGVALGGEPADPGIMDRPPRPPAESV